MAIQRFSGLMDDFMPQNFSTLLDRFFQDSVNQRQRMADFNPHVDTCETDNGYEIELTLPGLKKEDIRIELQEGRLTVSGERKFRNENQNKRYHVVESQYGTFTRSFQLPNNIDPAAINAEFQNGILRLTVPKDQQKSRKHQIEIKEGASQNQVSQGKPANGNGAAQTHQDNGQGQNGQTIQIEPNQKKAKAAST
ncbi:MAG: Hsp20/alpha crystallin family protein [Adhaeribacter sp.]|nr:Hsp20/alpha crystallin family protein [Adhaeribacter sp.]